MRFPIYQVDAFTSVVFAGNPAAVMMCEKPMPKWMMQKLADENNLSETAFLYAQDGGFNLRWFTPTTEVNLCGHATLASAHILFSENLISTNTISFFTKSGELTVTRASTRFGDGYEMNFPAKTFVYDTAPGYVLERLGFEPIETFYAEDNWVFVCSEQQVREFDRSFIDLEGKHGVILTAQSNLDDLDIVSRYFGFKSLGIEEDPVTGSAHCAIVRYWTAVLDKTLLVCEQASARGGFMECDLRGDRVLLRGVAATFMKGECFLDAIEQTDTDADQQGPSCE